jgi:asparagine synthase (glutamine-hydrolysing)
MAHSLELRVPFLDKEVWNFSRTIPAKFKVDKTNTKLVLRAAAEKEMDEKNAKRKKMAFPLPLPEWLREEKYFNQVKTLFNSETAQKYFDTKKLEKMLEEHRSGRNQARKIWTVFTFLVWYEEFFIKR